MASAPATMATASRAATAARPARRRWLERRSRRTCSSVARCFPARPALRRASRKARSAAVSAGRGPVAPLRGPRLPHPAVELAVGAAQLVPALGRDGEVAHDPQPVDVVVEPGAQPGPRHGEGLVGDLDGVAVAAQQPSRRPAARPRAVCSSSVATVRRAHPGADRLAAVVRRDEPQHQVAQHVLLARGQVAVEPLGGLGDGLPHAARRGIPLDGEGAALAAPPRLAQHVGQQGQRPGRALDLAHEQVDQSRLEPQPGLGRRSLDGRCAARAGPMAPEQVEAVLDEARELGVGGQLAEAVGAQRRGPAVPRAANVDQAGEERLPLRRRLGRGRAPPRTGRRRTPRPGRQAPGSATSSGGLPA